MSIRRLTISHGWSASLRSLGLLLLALLFCVNNTKAAVYNFTLGGPPPVALNPNTGQTIKMAGSGTFDTVAASVVGAGSYSISNSEGRVIERGNWEATQFSDFEAQGGPSPGIQGGILHLTITLFPKGGDPVTGVPMTVVCPVEDGAFDEDDDLAAVGAFTVPHGGITVFHLLRP